MSERILREPEVGRVTGLGRTTRYEMERRGEFPRRRQIGLGAVGWLESELLEWMRTRKTLSHKAEPNQWPRHEHSSTPRDADQSGPCAGREANSASRKAGMSEAT